MPVAIEALMTTVRSSMLVSLLRPAAVGRQ